EPNVGGALRQPPQVPRIPRVPVRDEVPHGEPLAGEADLFAGPDAVEHRDLYLRTIHAEGLTEAPGPGDQVDVVRSKHESQPAPRRQRVAPAAAGGGKGPAS